MLTDNTDVRRAIAERCDCFTEVGATEHAGYVLGRDRSDGRLILVTIRRHPGSSAPSYDCNFDSEFDLPEVGKVRCGKCDNSQVGWPVRCSHCGAALVTEGVDVDASLETVAALEAALRAQGNHTLSILGGIRQKGSGGTVFLAQDRQADRVFGFKVERCAGDADGWQMVPLWTPGRLDEAWFGGHIFRGPGDAAEKAAEKPGDMHAGAPARTGAPRWRFAGLVLVVVVLGLVAAAVFSDGSSTNRTAHYTPPEQPKPLGDSGIQDILDDGQAPVPDSARILDTGPISVSENPDNVPDPGAGQTEREAPSSPSGGGATGSGGQVQQPPNHDRPAPTHSREKGGRERPGVRERDRTRPSAPVLTDAEQVHLAVEAYADALRAQSIPRLRSAYPEITSREVQRWQAIFDDAPQPVLGVRWQVERRPSFRADTADFIFTLTVEYVDINGRPQRIPTSMRGVLQRQNDAWVLIRVLGLG